MKYMGSKARVAKYILPIIMEDRKPDQWYVEPFVGGANMIDKVDGLRLGSDNNFYLIEMFNHLKTKTIEFPHDKDHYSTVRGEYNKKSNDLFEDWYIGYVGFMASANGRFFEGGYSGVSITKLGTKRDYIDEAVRGLNKQLPKIKDVKFVACTYNELVLPKNSIVYCDPPYKDVKQYSTSKTFDHDKFWQWCRDKALEGHKVFISEYQAPDDFECIWQQEVKSSLSANGKQGGSKKSVERLFKYKGV